MALYHVGIDSGVLVDVGVNATHVFSIFDGYPLLSGTAAAACFPHLGGAKNKSVDDFFETTPFGMDEAIIKVIDLCEASLRPALISSIALIGGGTLLDGFAERLREELKTGLDDRPDLRAKVKVTARGDRRIAVWLGGATLAMTTAGKEQFVTKSAFDRAGSNLASCDKDVPTLLADQCGVLRALSISELEEEQQRSMAAALARMQTSGSKTCVCERSSPSPHAYGWNSVNRQRASVEQQRMRTLQTNVVRVLLSRH